MESSIKTVKFSEITNEKLNKISQTLGRNKRELFSQMVDYFYKNKKDPADLNDELLKSTLVKSHKTYMGFIKSQEELLLIPTKAATEKMIANQKDIVRFFNEQVLGVNKRILQNQENQQKLFLENDKVLKVIQQQLDTKTMLKEKMLHLLNTYIKSREELGSFKAKEKELLADAIRKQIYNL
jgi:hypothetical protein